MIAFMLGAATIVDGSDIVGVAFPSALDCDEAGTRRSRSSSGPSMSSDPGLDATYPYFHWVFPSTSGQIGDNTFEEGPAEPTLNGFTQTNANWGDGPYGDGPPDGEDIREGGFWATDDDAADRGVRAAGGHLGQLGPSDCSPETYRRGGGNTRPLRSGRDAGVRGRADNGARDDRDQRGDSRGASDAAGGGAGRHPGHLSGARMPVVGNVDHDPGGVPDESSTFLRTVVPPP